MEVLCDTFDMPTPQEIIESWRYGKDEKNYDDVFEGTNTEKIEIPEDRPQRESVQKGRYYVNVPIATRVV